MPTVPSAVSRVDLLRPFFAGRQLPAPVSLALGKMLKMERLNALYSDVATAPANQLPFGRLLDLLNVHVDVTPDDLKRIPTSGPVVLVANHPFGFIEGCVLAAILPRIRPDVRIMANSLIAGFEALSDHFLFVNPFGGNDATRQNRRGMREALHHLRSGGLLVVFPAGEVSHLDLRQRAVVDPAWNPAVARLARLAGASVVPAFFNGANSAWFQFLGMVHPRLRTALLPHEFLNKQSSAIELRIGTTITPTRLSRCADEREAIDLLRERTYILRHRRRCAQPPSRARAEPIIAAVSPQQMFDEVAALGPERQIASLGELVAVTGWSHEIPGVLREIGRLRETTFRLVGEGTGRTLDLDAFDAHYLHLFLWNPAKREIAGAYRMGPTDEILRNHGLRGLYTTTLFRYDAEFLSRLGGPAVELGRSFVRPEYQKDFAPLLLLWKGIAAWVARHPRYRALFGPVTISNDYTPLSRRLMVSYFSWREREERLAPLVSARNPFREPPRPGTARVDDLEELTTLVSELEKDGKGVPVLLRQYLKLGGKFAGFNLDPSFSNALDGMIVVNLDRTDRRVLERYMGKDGTEAYFSGYGSSQ